MNATVQKSNCSDFTETPTSIEILANCDLLYNAEGGSEVLPYWTENLLPKVEALLPDYQLEYLCPEHALKFGGSCHFLKVGKLDFNPLDCGLSYTNERGELVTYFIPQDQFVYDSTTCTLTILPAKGQPGMVIPTGVPQSEVALSLTPGCNGCSLRFQYKDKICDVALPNMIVGCSYNLATNTLTMLHCDGTDKPIQLPKASLDCITLDDGTQVLSFSNGCPGGDKMFNIPGITLDTDSLTVVGSQLTFTYGGDGNPGTVQLDICDIVATHCNATITAQYPGGGFDFIDNAGNTFEVRPINCCTFLGNNPAVLDAGSPPAGPAGVWPNKADRDTAIECHPNGLSFWNCINGAWSLGFTKIFTDCCAYQVVDNTPIDPVNPPVAPPNDPQLANKADRDTVIVCHPNGWCAYTCVLGVWSRDWCKVDPVIPELPTHQSPDGSVSITYDAATNTWNYTVTHPAIPSPEKETFKAGDTLPTTSENVTVCDADGNEFIIPPGGTLPVTMVGCVQVDEVDGTTAYFPPKARTTPPEVWIGQGQPDKDAGFTTWFDPITCIVKFCDNNGDWLEPRVLVCQEVAPNATKGQGPQIWYKPSVCCLFINCEGVWLAMATQIDDPDD